VWRAFEFARARSRYRLIYCDRSVYIRVTHGSLLVLQLAHCGPEPQRRSSFYHCSAIASARSVWLHYFTGRGLLSIRIRRCSVCCRCCLLRAGRRRLRNGAADRMQQVESLQVKREVRSRVARIVRALVRALRSATGLCWLMHRWRSRC
jgi:hypothetical protein